MKTPELVQQTVVGWTRILCIKHRSLHEMQKRFRSREAVCSLPCFQSHINSQLYRLVGFETDGKQQRFHLSIPVRDPRNIVLVSSAMILMRRPAAFAVAHSSRWLHTNSVGPRTVLVVRRLNSDGAALVGHRHQADKCAKRWCASLEICCLSPSSERKQPPPPLIPQRCITSDLLSNARQHTWCFRYTLFRHFTPESSPSQHFEPSRHVGCLSPLVIQKLTRSPK